MEMCHMSQYERYTLKQYGPENADEQIAWVHAHKVHEGAGYLNIGMGIVGPDGASFGFLANKEKAVHAYSSDSIRGLKPSFHAEILIRTDSDTPYVDEQSAWGYPDADGSHLLRVLTDHTESNDDIVWAEGSQNTASTLKAELGKIGLESAYGYAYYAFNSLIGHSMDMGRLLITDQEMQNTTISQLEAAQKVLEALYDLRRLGSSSLALLSLQEPSLSIEEILAHVEENDKISTTITEELRSDHIRGLVFGRNLRYGRDWPFRDDRVSRVPKKGESVLSYIEHIGRRNDYLDQVIQYARRGYRVLNTLSEAEKRI